MATIVNNPGNTDSGSGAGMIVGVIVGILVILALIFFVVPGLRGAGGGGADTKQIDVNVGLDGAGGGEGAPAGGTGY